LALSLNSNVTDEVLGRQFKAFIESLFSYSPQITSTSTNSRSNLNGTVIENMFGEMTDQIKIASDAAIKELEKVSKK